MTQLFHGLLFGFGGAVGVRLALGLFIGAISTKRDATDSPDKRSGFALMVDHGTGREYLVTPSGSVTPRLPAIEEPGRAD